MLKKLEKIKERYVLLGEQLSDPAVIADQERFRELAKEHSQLSSIVSAFDEYSAALASQDE
ncbi:MAG: PCRF domain-containing protein, partial [Clostridia bacterium]|nr:PCRF domain-containing protein [Clostridia bacterium]